jgi:hypothetical protein
MIFLIIYSMANGMPRQHQAFAQSSMTMNLAKLLTNDAIQALNHKDINGAVEHLRLIGQQFPRAFAQNSTMTMNLAKLLAGDAIQALNHKDINGAVEHLRLIGQELGISRNSTNLMNPSSGVVVRLK